MSNSSPAQNEFELEAYWGTTRGQLMHGTIHVCAASIERAIRKARTERIKPRNTREREPACETNRYYEDHYDVEPIGDEYDDIRKTENFNAIAKAIGESR